MERYGGECTGGQGVPGGTCRARGFICRARAFNGAPGDVVRCTSGRSVVRFDVRYNP